MDYLVRRIRARSRAAGDCWEWTGMLSHGLTPVMRIKRGEEWTAQPVRRVIMLAQGASPELRARYSCSNKLCVRPEHVEAGK